MEKAYLEPTMDNVEELIFAADYLEMNSALQILLVYLSKDLSNQDPKTMKRQVLLMYLRLMRIIGDKEPKVGLKKYTAVTKEYKKVTWQVCPSAINIIAMKFKSVMYEKSVLDLDYIDLYDILSCNGLNIQEEDVARTIKMWVNYKYSDRKKDFASLIRCMRFDKDMEVSFDSPGKAKIII